MILTGPAIAAARAAGDITIEPFDPERLNPNSYNFALGDGLRVYAAEILDPDEDNATEEIALPPEGIVLEPRRLYLAHTAEVLGGRRYAPTFAARSSVARLGLFIHCSGGLGDVGYVGQWTLQLVAEVPIRVRPGMRIGQMSWWVAEGEPAPYGGKYQGARGAVASRAHLDRK